MMVRGGLLVIAPLLLAGCVESSCTLIGCRDQASLAFHRADWAMLSLDVELDIGGRQVTCPAPTMQSVGPRCDNDVTVMVHGLADCHEERSESAVRLVCVPNGKFEQVVTIDGTPPRVDVTLRSGATVVGRRAFDLTYTESRPNGPRCEPLCRQSSQTWEVP